MAAITVLLVDDNAAFRQLATRFLEEEAGQEVVVVGSVGSGEEALAQAEHLRPKVVLLDLRMPGLSGLETIPRLRCVAPDTRIVVLTLLDGDGYRRASLGAGADAFVGKANVTRDLLPAIRQVVRPDRPRMPGADGDG